jgi:cysteine desulfurase
VTRPQVYLDWNATTPLADRVRSEMDRVRPLGWANPSSVHAHGRAARSVLEGAREAVGARLRAHPKDLIFTAGATEANHLALSGATSIVTSRIEHPSIVRQAEHWATLGRPVRFARTTPGGTVDLDSLHECFVNLKLTSELGSRPLLAVMAVSHETGVLQPLSEARAVADEFQADLHVDAVQLIGRGSLGVLQLADSLSVAGHKICGPKGIGVLVVRCGRSPSPVGFGGAQERGLRPGTLDAVLAAGVGAAFEGLDEISEGFAGCESLRDELEVWLTRRGASVHGSGPRLAHVSNFRLPGWKGDELVAALDLEGVSISAGSACAAGTAELSPTILAMLGRDAAEGAVRVSFGPGSTPDDLGRLLEALTRLIAR